MKAVCVAAFVIGAALSGAKAASNPGSTAAAQGLSRYGRIHVSCT